MKDKGVIKAGLFIFGLMAMGTTQALEPANNLATGQNMTWTLADTYGDWQLVCTEQGDKSCRAIQALDVTQNEQAMRVLEVVVFYAENQARMTMTLPLGLDLLPGLVVKIDENEEIRLPFSTCLADGCRVMGNIGEDVMAQLMAGSLMKVGFRSFGEQQTLVLDVSLRGSSRAFKAAENRPVVTR